MDHAYLISIPRDLRVHIPPDPDDRTSSGAHDKINGAFQYGGGGIGGYQLLSRTLNQLTGVRFDGAAIVDFDGFKTAVGILGGVDLCVDVRTESIHTARRVRARLPAPAGLAGAGLRPSAGDCCRNDDYDRERHQQQFLKAIFATALRQGVATNPIKLDQFIRAVGSAMTVDTNGVTAGGPRLRAAQHQADGAGRHPDAVGTGDHRGHRATCCPPTRPPALYQAIVSDTLDTWVVANQSWVNPI